MRFLRRHWYNLGPVVGGIAVAWAFFGHLTTVQFILLLNFAAITLHEFEEYGWPGGFPWILNEVMRPGGPADRFPANQNNAFIVNVFMVWPFYLIPVFFPDVVWLGLAPTLFGFGQLIAHGVVMNRAIKRVYSPGLVTVILGFIPLGIWYLIEVYSKNMITGWDWVFGVVYLAFFSGVCMAKIGHQLLTDKNSNYPYAPEELERFDRAGCLARLRAGMPVTFPRDAEPSAAADGGGM